MQTQINFIKLIYPPISNQEADWLWEDERVRDYVSSSKLYLIAQRREVFFEDFRWREGEPSLIFDLVMGSTAIRNVVLPFDHFDDDLELELGNKMIRVWRAGEIGQDGALLEWFTADSLLFDYWRGARVVLGLEDYRQFTTFDLFYVGISKKDDSLTRLFKTGHKARTKILSNETQIGKNARLTDELFIFLMDFEALGFSTLLDDSEEAIAKFLASETVTDLRLVADAEKALVKVLDTSYNKEKYAKYPTSKDGLKNAGLSRWAFTIDEPLTFRTDRIEMSFKRWLENPLAPSMGDTIHVDGASVQVGSPDGSAVDII